ncbi:hypothetical protein A7U60_g7935 [Sanghuangporus baumii]|uniref:Uncharacterized protein n=1 Tax=Sanghuangporus baumii TaxID=108892 RepID=A0A9Q5HS89_SANBA|nr:hypothetical protein A7U60_g7935 [Sanghuangporus baumii]
MDAGSSSPASCRIVVVSSSLETSREIAHRIKALSGDNTSESPSSSEVIHWTIKNKYYTAPVHFHPIHLEGLEFIELDDVPAVIYAWKENEPYRAHMKQLVEQTSSYNPEVSLAISMAPTTDEELEDFFFEHGFEYVEGHTEVEADRLDPSATPGIRRAVDALSTIMWPSMIRTDQKTSILTSQSSNSVATEGEDEIDLDYRTLMNDAGDNGRSNIQHELEMLEKWLENDDDEDYENPDDKNGGYTSLDSHEQSFSNDPWTTTTPGAPTNVEGFDDDFTEFISAPSISSRTESKLDDDSDSDLPSHADIQAASARIFGPTTSSHSTGPDSSHSKSAGSEPELDMDSPAFDLTRVLGTLETMKDEISSMPDVRERRRAAAKAALGFVYGLEETNSELDAAARLA